MPQERQEEQGPRKRRLRWRSRTRTRTSNLLPPVKRKRLIIPVTNSVEPDTIRRRPRSLQSDRQGATFDFDSEEDPVNERSVVQDARRVSSIKAVSHNTERSGRNEMDSHTNTIVAGNNCDVIALLTGRNINISPFSDEYASIDDIPLQPPMTAQTQSESSSLS